jgi:ribosome-binding factor A
VSPDLGVAKVFVSIFPIVKTKEVEEFISLNQNKIRGSLGRSVGNQLRVTPELMIYSDDSLEYEENIERLLRGEGENPIK